LKIELGVNNIINKIKNKKSPFVLIRVMGKLKLKIKNKKSLLF